MIKYNKKIYFLFFGGINTVFGYCNSLLLYFLFRDIVNIVVILIFINIINISFSFVTLKYFVFKSKNPFFPEYMKSLVLYSGAIFLSTFILYLLYELLSLKFYIASLITTILMLIYSYYGNEKFTFKK